MNPAVTLKPQENGNAFKQLVALDGNDYQFHRPFPYESGQEGKRHDNDPGGDDRENFASPDPWIIPMATGI